MRDRKSVIESNRVHLFERVVGRSLGRFKALVDSTTKRKDLLEKMKKNQEYLVENKKEMMHLLGKEGKKMTDRGCNNFAGKMIKGVDFLKNDSGLGSEKFVDAKAFARLKILAPAVKKMMENPDLDATAKMAAYKALFNNVNDCMSVREEWKEEKKQKAITMIKMDIDNMDSVEKEYKENKKTVRETMRGDDDCNNHPELRILGMRERSRKIRYTVGLTEKIVGCYKWTKNWLAGKGKATGKLWDRIA